MDGSEERFYGVVFMLLSVSLHIALTENCATGYDHLLPCNVWIVVGKGTLIVKTVLQAMATYCLVMCGL